MIALCLIRQNEKMTQSELAERMGVTPNCISQWENGLRKPNIIQLKKLAAILNCTTDELLNPIEI